DYSRRLGLKWVYPGFWIERCDKMSYKSRFRPFEAWNGQQWIDHSRLKQGGNGMNERI
ncbi:MAG: hypothetical protein KME44_20175, partial [Candidatus Thiodiazotropha sp. (ex Lucina pensylvanica)]|nr:hypothetical protein [Candidatus Thiodiazotropha sp. (ex Lucina pensylvanica)]